MSRCTWIFEAARDAANDSIDRERHMAGGVTSMSELVSVNIAACAVEEAPDAVLAAVARLPRAKRSLFVAGLLMHAHDQEEMLDVMNHLSSGRRQRIAFDAINTVMRHEPTILKENDTIIFIDTDQKCHSIARPVCSIDGSLLGVLKLLYASAASHTTQPPFARYPTLHDGSFKVTIECDVADFGGGYQRTGDSGIEHFVHMYVDDVFVDSYQGDDDDEERQLLMQSVQADIEEYIDHTLLESWDDTWTYGPPDHGLLANVAPALTILLKRG